MSSTELPVSTLKPPRSSLNAFDWLRRNLFNSWLNSIVTIVLGSLIVTVLYRVLNWALTGAFWTPIPTNLQILMTGRYPSDQVWRLQLCVALVLLLFGLSAGLWGGILRTISSALAAAALLGAVLPFVASTRFFLLGLVAAVAVGFIVGLRAPRGLRRVVLALWLLSPLIMIVLIRGFVGVGVLPFVGTGLWGGLLLTIMLAVVGITASFPLGLLLALGRRSKLPVVKGFCIAYIELIRGVPLITVLFMAMIMLPLFLPANVRVDNLVRVFVAITLFSAAYLAENVRGGLQAVPNGQVEAAKALGLNVFQTMTFIVLPQALRAVIPAIVGQFISLFKDTSLVAIVGLFELLGMADLVIEQPAWLTVPNGVQREVLLFVGLIYWVFCFSMSQVSRRLEQRLGAGTR
jgi:general L-amino acid transport system permease protein